MPKRRRRPIASTPVLLAAASALLLPAVAAAQELVPRAASIRLGGRVQPQFTTSSVEGDHGDFFIRRGRLTLDVTVNDFVSGRVQPELAGSAVELKDVYLRLAFDPAFRVSMGQFKRPFSIFELFSSTDLHVERDGRIEGMGGCPGVGGICSFSRLTEKLELDDRDQGILIDGAFGGGLSYTASLTNGQGTNASDVNDAKSLTGRVVWTAGSLAVGVFGALHDHLPGDGEDTEYAPAAGADVEYGTWRDGPHLVAALAFGDNWRAGPDADFTAAQVLGSWYLPVGSPRLAGLEPLFRLSWADAGGEEGDDSAGLLLTPGFVAYLTPKNGLAANLDHYTPRGDTDPEWSFKLKAFMYF